MTWRDADDRVVDVPVVPSGEEPAFYLPVGEFQGALYRRNAFAAYTDHEVAALVARLDLQVGDTVLDVGCGDGRHLRALAELGMGGVGVDVSPALIGAARGAAAEMATGSGPGVAFVVGDARRLGDVPGVESGAFDVAWSLCQGGFGTSPRTDADVLAGLAAAVRPEGLVVFTAFHTLFAVRHLAAGDAFDPVDQVHHQQGEVRGPDDTRRTFDLWTASYTSRDVRHLAASAGLEVVEVVGAEPGRYDGTSVGLDDPELLVVTRVPDRPPGA